MNNAEIQKTLTRSYISYFLFIILGLFLDSLFDFSVKIPFSTFLAILCFVIGTILIVWAQFTTGKKLEKEQTLKNFFINGPYKYLRNPTHLGFVFLITGYTALSGSVFFLVGTIVGYFVSSFYFKKYEKLLIEKFDQDYIDYKRKVPKIL